MRDKDTKVLEYFKINIVLVKKSNSAAIITTTSYMTV